MFVISLVAAAFTPPSCLMLGADRACELVFPKLDTESEMGGLTADRAGILFIEPFEL
jgi:hypothetical protein